MNKYLILILFTQLAFGQQTKRKLVWEENFDGNTLNDKVWNIELGDGCPKNCGWGNHERQTYTDQNHRLENGKLIITARKKDKQYTSTRLNTQHKKEFQYGRFEICAKLPSGKGLWPAFWLLGINVNEVGWPKCGEIDILEYIGREPNMAYTTLHTQNHYGDSGYSKRTLIRNLSKGFHVYAVDWTKDKMVFFIDNRMVYTFHPKTKTKANWSFDQPFYFILNLAIGGDFGGKVDDTIFPQDFVIDYIKVYQ